LIQIAVNLPGNRTDLKKIKGVGKKTFKKYGQDILALVAGYRQKRGIDREKLPTRGFSNKF
jgi:superfamily II DNA helicase RecQ